VQHLTLDIKKENKQMKNIRNQTNRLSAREIPAGLEGMVRKIRPESGPGKISESSTIPGDPGISLHRDLAGMLKKFAPGKNLICLFSGAGGTGKTLAARLIAGQLDREVYRIDLSAVVSKYIGETEKNLTHLFDTARSRDAILFFDEADALFGKRTEVKDSHDRYANIEISYLLQRIQDYPGLVILSSEKKHPVDPVFLRRIDCTIDFRRIPRTRR
jgi:hypothetical protein